MKKSPIITIDVSSTEAPAFVSKMPMLDRLMCGRIFGIIRRDDVFVVTEFCNEYYSQIMTAEELRALGNEIIAMSNHGALKS